MKRALLIALLAAGAVALVTLVRPDKTLPPAPAELPPVGAK